MNLQYIKVIARPEGVPKEERERAKELLRRSAILLDHNEQIPLAVLYKREESDLQVAWLPNPVFNQVKWVELITLNWAQSDQERFPEFGDWTKSTEWMTNEEEILVTKINKLEASKQEAINEFGLKIDSLHSDLVSANLFANKGLRRLITAQGKDLADEVANIFQEFGFEVEEIDETLDPNLPKREDLRLRDPEDNTGWEAIVEVRGYLKSAGKTSDLQRLSRFATLYNGEKGRLPDKQIYVVNGQIELPPDQRQKILAPAEEDVQVFGENCGIVISSLDLYKSVKLLDKHGRDKIRDSVKNATERWTIDSIGN